MNDNKSFFIKNLGSNEKEDMIVSNDKFDWVTNEKNEIRETF